MTELKSNPAAKRRFTMTPILWGAVALLLSIAGYDFWLRMQPAYDGEPVSFWVNGACTANDPSDYMAKIPKIGAPAVPYLIAKLKTKDSRWYESYTNFVARLPGAIGARMPRPDNPATTRGNAISCLAMLGPIAKPAIPQLMQTFQETAFPDQIYLAEAIWSIDGDTNLVLPICHRALTQSTNRTARFTAMFVLSDLGPVGAPEAPALVPLLTDKTSRNGWRALAARTLGQINYKDDSVLAALQDGMKATNMTLSFQCAVSLWKLDGQYARPALTSILTQMADYNRRNSTKRLSFGSAVGSRSDLPLLTNAVPLLKEFQQSDDSEIRQIATEALKDIEPSSAP